MVTEPGKHPVMLITDARGQVVYSSTNLSEMCLPAPDGGIGKHWRELIDAREKHATENGLGFAHHEFEDKQDASVIYHVQRFPCRDRQGDPNHFVIIEAVQDGGEENRLLHCERMFSLGEMAAGVAHEINNPLSVIFGWLQLLLDDVEPSSPQYDTYKTMNDEVERITKIVKNLLSFSQRAASEIKPLQLNQVIEDVLHLTSYQMRHEDVTVETDLAEGLPAVAGDEVQLKQVFLNLVVNARQAMSAGGSLRVTTRLEDDCVVAEVQDTGCGIAAAHLEHIFESFYTTKQGAGGTGLGLPVSLGIVRNHGGTLRVTSEPKRGSTFYVTLPAVRESAGVETGA